MGTKKPLVRKAAQAPVKPQPQPDSEPKVTEEPTVEEIQADPELADGDEDTEPEDDNNTEEGEQDESEPEQVDGAHQLSPSKVDETKYDDPPAPLDRTANPMVNQDADHEPTDFGSLPGAPQGNVLVLGPDEPLRVDGEPSPDGTFVRLNKAVYRAKLPMGSKRWTFLLEYPAHAQIPMSIVQPVQRDESAPTVYPYTAQP